MSTGTNKERIEQNNELLNQIKTTIDNLPSAGSASGVKLFETEEAMQADTTAKEGDLAVVYRSEIKSISNGDVITSITFPKTVVFDTAITSSYYGRLRNSSEPRIYLDIQLDASRFMLYDMYGTIPEIEYSSTDGITYTRTDSNEDTYEIGETTVKNLDEHICKFMQVGGYVFEGLFQYTNTVDGNTLKVYKDIHSTGSTITGTEYELDMRPYTNKILELVGDTSVSAKMIGIIGLNGHIYMVRTYADQYTLNAVYIANQLVLDIGQGTGTRAILQSLDSSDNITLELNTNSDIYRLYNGTKSYYYEGLNSIEFLGNILVYQNKLTNSASGFVAQTYLRGITNQTNDQTIISSINNTLTPVYKLAYVSAPTQLTTISNDVYKSIFYGKNGVETGTLTENISDSFSDLNAEIYSNIQDFYNSMEPRVLTDDDKTIDKNIYLIPANSNGAPLLDTSNVTDMTSMFWGSTNLRRIPLLDTSNVTNMNNMFTECKNLTTIPLLNTSNVTDMSSMFSNCQNLTTVPLLDTSNVVDMNQMFNDCENLTSIPQLDTSKVINMKSIFSNCENLTSIPLLNTSNVTDISGMFRGCKNLTTVPLLDTSNVTDMSSTFSSCQNLTTIPLLDTSNVTNMNNMFLNCQNLTTVPLLDTSNVTDMYGMFWNCENLTTIPLLDTSNVTNTNSMFYGCTNLATVPQLDTSKVRNMVSMFDGCTNLTTVPVLVAYNMRYMFRNCTNLSDESLNNILKMCTDATSYNSIKTLSNVGLSSEQANRCKTLSNYSAFTAAGWTTGF